MTETRTPLHTGGCQCGAVRYALYAEPTNPHVCHCRMCQKAFGNYFAPFAGLPPKDFAWVKGTPGLFKSSEVAERGFCRDCGTPLFFRAADKDRISVSLGSLDDPVARGAGQAVRRREPAAVHGDADRHCPACAPRTTFPRRIARGSRAASTRIPRIDGGPRTLSL